MNQWQYTYALFNPNLRKPVFNWTIFEQIHLPIDPIPFSIKPYFKLLCLARKQLSSCMYILLFDIIFTNQICFLSIFFSFANLILRPGEYIHLRTIKIICGTNIKTNVDFFLFPKYRCFVLLARPQGVHNEDITQS